MEIWGFFKNDMRFEKVTNSYRFLFSIPAERTCKAIPESPWCAIFKYASTTCLLHNHGVIGKYIMTERNEIKTIGCSLPPTVLISSRSFLCQPQESQPIMK